MNLLTERTARDAALIVVDMQEKLLAVMNDRSRVVGNTLRLIQAASVLKIPVHGTEQYPKGLGPTIPEIAELIPNRGSKLTFSCCKLPEIVEQLHGRAVRHVTVAGIEAHICIAQSALDLLRMGFSVTVPADAVSSRFPLDWEFALRRLEHAGAVVSTTEAILFEWIGTADSAHFKEISRLVKTPVA